MKDESRLNYRCFRNPKGTKRYFQQLHTSVFENLEEIDIRI